jgi:hypothetical protein
MFFVFTDGACPLWRAVCVLSCTSVTLYERYDILSRHFDRALYGDPSYIRWRNERILMSQLQDNMIVYDDDDDDDELDGSQRGHSSSSDYAFIFLAPEVCLRVELYTLRPSPSVAVAH